MTNLAWRQSSRASGGESNCVEVAPFDQRLAVRGSKRPHGPVLVVPAEAWRAFVGRTK